MDGVMDLSINTSKEKLFLKVIMRRKMQTLRYITTLCTTLLLFPQQNVYANLNIRLFKHFREFKEQLNNNMPPDFKISDLGDLHNTIMVRVHDRALLFPPRTAEEFDSLVYEEVNVLCKDRSCRRAVRRGIAKKRSEIQLLMKSGKSFDIEYILPPAMDDDLKFYLIQIYQTVHLLDSDGLVTFLTAINEILNEVENRILIKRKRFVIQCVISIAKGSAAFWTEMKDNPNSIVNKLQAEDRRRRRRLNLSFEVLEQSFKDNFTFDIVDVVISDILGAVWETGFPNPFALLSLALNPIVIDELAIEMLIGAVLGSLEAMGIVIQIPTPFDYIECAFFELLPDDTPVPDIPIFEEVPMLRDFVEDFINTPCNTTTLFGPFMGPIIQAAFPEMSSLIDDTVETNDIVVAPIGTTVPSTRTSKPSRRRRHRMKI